VDLLGLSGRSAPSNPAAERVQAIDRGDYVEEKYALDVGDVVPAPMYVLVPKTAPPYKAIMAFHGHAPSVQYMLGNYPDEAIAAERLSKDANYAQALAQAGYLVCAVEQRGFGERVSDQRIPPENENTCRHLSFEYLMQGRTMVGERCWDGMVAISYMLNRPDVVAGTLGATGNSGGGTTTLWLSAIDERITTPVVSCYFCSFHHSILGMRHCECNYVPRILDLAEMGDLAALIAPRPLRIIAGEQDPIFPAEGVRQQFETLKRAYALWDADDKVSLTFHPGEHAYNIPMAKAWFGAYL
jgi:dienelactone hydrolase